MDYPPTLCPKLGTTRKNKRTFCHRLALNLAHFDAHPEVWHNTVYAGQKLPPYLRLPAELRQGIIALVVDDEAIFWPGPNSETRDLALVCKTFAEDVKVSCGLRDRKDEEMKEMKSSGQFTWIERYIEDLMGPVRSARRLTPVRPSRRSVKMAARRAAWREKTRRAKQSGRDECGDDDEFVVRELNGKLDCGDGNGEYGRPLKGEEEEEEEEHPRDPREERRKVKQRRRKEKKMGRRAEKKERDRAEQAVVDRSHKQWEEDHPVEARLAKLRAAYCKARPHGAHDFSEKCWDAGKV